MRPKAAAAIGMTISTAASLALRRPCQVSNSPDAQSRNEMLSPRMASQVPRLLAVGAKMDRIVTVRAVLEGHGSRRTFNLQTDLAQLEGVIKGRGDVRLVIIDPISSYLGKVDSHKNAEVRSVLEPLGEMAARLHVAVVCNNHFSK